MSKTLQQMIELTPAQSKAWRRLERAVKDFQAAGGAFYCVLDTVHGYNSEFIKGVDECGEHHTQSVCMPSFEAAGMCSFSDDWHGFTLKSGVELNNDGGEHG